jgi:hypothetical protein
MNLRIWAKVRPAFSLLIEEHEADRSYTLICEFVGNEDEKSLSMRVI